MDNAQNETGDSIAPSRKVTRTKRTTPSKKTAATTKPVVAPSSNGHIDVPLPKAGLGQISAHDAKMEYERWLWRNYIPEGALVVLSGAGGVGKSSLLAHILAGVSNGTLEGDFEGQPQNSIWYSREDSTTVSLKGKLVAAEADLRRIIMMDQNGEHGGTTLTLPADLGRLAQDVKDSHFKVIVLDLLMSFCETKRSLHQNYGNVVRVFSQIAEMCATNKVTVIGVMHNGRGTKEASADSVVSSLAIPGVARQVLMVGDLGDTGKKVVGVVKSNISKTMIGMVYHVDYVDVGRDPATNDVKQASQIVMERPASRTEVAACLEKPKGIGDATPQIKVLLTALATPIHEDGEDGEVSYTAGPELATKTEVYPKVREELGGVKLRRFQDIVADALAMGLIHSRLVGGGSDQRNLIRITNRGLMLINPPKPDFDAVNDDGDDDEADTGSMTGPSNRPEAEVTFTP